MFTWNFQLISKVRLAETLNQLTLDQTKGDILIRIHTATHKADEAVDLAKFIKGIVPAAHIFGTSTSAIICDGKLLPDNCLVSVTQMNGGRIKSAILPVFESEAGETTDAVISPEKLCENIKENVITPETKLLLAFISINYHDIYNFVEKSNDYFPGIHMIGGIADVSGSTPERMPVDGFVFDENGWTDKGIIIASLNGSGLDVLSSYATGVEAIGKEMEVTDSFKSVVLSFDNKDAASQYRVSIGDELKVRPELTNLFPYVYTELPDSPVFFHYMRGVCIGDILPPEDATNQPFYDTHPDITPDKKLDILNANHHIDVGKKMQRSFIYSKKIISDNRSLYRKIEAFDKAETLFAYSCIVRSVIYSNCIKWELSAYENSNMSGCITYGEITNINGKNKFVNGSFVVSVMGENSLDQAFNPYAFQYANSLSVDNKALLNYLTTVERKLKEEDDDQDVAALRNFARECEIKILYSDKTKLPNQAALNIDIENNGIDRVCIIDVLDTTSMKTVFSKELVDLTYKNYISKCEDFAKSLKYKIYLLSDWRIAIGAPSYRVSLSGFTHDMDELQKNLFRSSKEYISIIPTFSVLDNCSVGNYMSAYNSARIRMWQKNMQFYSCDAMESFLDEDSIREKYHMVNVINYAIENDKVIPFFQGIYNNKENRIAHYEALMRLEDEYGRIYYPGEFLDVARNYGLLYDGISRMMIQKVFEKFKDSEQFSVSINLGMRDIRNQGLVDYIYDSLSMMPYPENFIFELLENEDIDDYDNMMLFVDKIHELGGRISIDDFGSGFSNLQHVISLQSDIVKIDGSIVRNCCSNHGAENLIALIAAWKGLSRHGIILVAEYVENEDIQNKILDYGIDYSQGYLFSKPSKDINI